MTEIKGLNELAQHVEDASEKQRKANLVDLDEALQEFNNEHPELEFRLFGKSFYAPGTMTTDVYTMWLSLQSHVKKNGDEAAAEATFKLLEQIFGHEFVDEAKAKRLPVKFLFFNVLNAVFNHYAGQGKGESPKNKKAPTS